MKTINTDERDYPLLDNGGFHRDPFKVPEGYFETLTQRTMNNIDAVEQRRRKHNLAMKLWKYSAAACIVIVAGIALWLHSPQPIDTVPQEEEAWQDLYLSSLAYDDLDEALDYALLDNDDIAYYLTEL